MSDRPTDAPIDELLGGASVFVSALNGVMEQKLLSEMAGSRLSLSQLKVFKLLDVSGPRNIGHVAAFLGMSNAAASKTVDRLVRGKYLRRVEARADRRASEISLADAGRKLLDRYQTARSRAGPGLRQPGTGRRAPRRALARAPHARHRRPQWQCGGNLPAMRHLPSEWLRGAGRGARGLLLPHAYEDAAVARDAAIVERYA